MTANIFSVFWNVRNHSQNPISFLLTRFISLFEICLTLFILFDWKVFHRIGYNDFLSKNFRKKEEKIALLNIFFFFFHFYPVGNFFREYRERDVIHNPADTAWRRFYCYFILSKSNKYFIIFKGFRARKILFFHVFALNNRNIRYNCSRIYVYSVCIFARFQNAIIVSLTAESPTRCSYIR